MNENNVNTQEQVNEVNMEEVKNVAEKLVEKLTPESIKMLKIGGGAAAAGIVYLVWKKKLVSKAIGAVKDCFKKKTEEEPNVVDAQNVIVKNVEEPESSN